MARPFAFNQDDDSSHTEKTYDCKWCDSSITEEEYYGQNELCSKCYAEFLEDFGGE